MNFILLPGGSAGFEQWLAKWFPPRLTPLDPEAHKEVIAYQYRISRKGVERHPTMFAGAQIVRVIEGEAKPKPSRRRNIACEVCSTL